MKNLTASALTPVAMAMCLFGNDTMQAAVLPSGFAESMITGPISSGTAMEFAPDGKLFVLEQGGTVEVYQGSGAGIWTQVAPSNNFFTGYPLSVNAVGERGLLGIAFDPNYASNRFLYVYYTTASVPIHNRISRFTANATGTQVVSGSEAPLMDLETLSSATNHNGGAMHFGIDGKLYVAVGDNANSSNSQTITNRLGKMLRLNPNPADPIPLDNPTSISGISGTPSGLNRAIWAAGLRNPFTFAFRPHTTTMYINDVGQGTYEEVNVARPGWNFGWPDTGDGPFDQLKMPNYRHPLVAYPRPGGNEPNYPSGLSYAGRAITGGAFYVPQTATFPVEYLADYFFADFVDGWIRRYEPPLNTVANFATGILSPVDLKVGSDGALYYLARGSGRVFRVQATTPPPCLADIVDNNIVDISDLLAVVNAWGPCFNCPADISPVAGNSTVEVTDLLAVINAWGACP